MLPELQAFSIRGTRENSDRSQRHLIYIQLTFGSKLKVWISCSQKAAGERSIISKS
jgi:hypothetical protein